MDEGLEAKIGAILSDPQQMEKISNLAMQLMGSGSAESGNNLGEKQEEQVSSAMGREADTGLGAMLSGRVVWGIVSILLYGIQGNLFSWQLFLGGAILNAVPGILLQLVLIPVIIILLEKTGLMDEYVG